MQPLGDVKLLVVILPSLFWGEVCCRLCIVENRQERVDEEVSQYVRTLAGKKREAEETDATAKSLIEATSKMLYEQNLPFKG